MQVNLSAADMPRKKPKRPARKRKTSKRIGHAWRNEEKQRHDRHRAKQAADAKPQKPKADEKTDERAFLNDAVATFLADGGQITHLAPCCAIIANGGVPA